MKGFTKLCLALGGVCTAAGMGLCISGVLLGYEPGSVLGEYREKAEMIRDGSYELSQVQEYENITSLEVDVGAADCRILAYDGDKVRVETDSGKYLTGKKTGEKLKVSYGPENFNLFWQNFGGVNFIIIYLPQGEALEELKVKGGAASITIEKLVCEKVSLEIGAGSVSYQGLVEKELSADCGLGSVDLMLDGKPNDFNYDLECGLGSISVERGPNIAGAGENKMDNKASKRMWLECGLGSVDVSFSE